MNALLFVFALVMLNVGLYIFIAGLYKYIAVKIGWFNSEHDPFLILPHLLPWPFIFVADIVMFCIYGKGLTK